MKYKSVLMIVILLISTFTILGNFISDNNLASGATLYVGSDSTHKTIQDAVDAASDGDIIYVKAETYNENVVITTHGITLIGNSSAGTELIGNSGAALKINANWVNITSFNISTSTDSVIGILIENSNNCSLMDNMINTSGDTGADGIRVFNSQNVKVYDNTINITGSSSAAIYLDDAVDNQVFRNNINISNAAASYSYGIQLKSDNIDNLITYNNITAFDDWGNGITVELYSHSNDIMYNDIYVKSPGNTNGFRVMNSDENTISYNNITVFYASGNPFNIGINIFNSPKKNYVEHNTIDTRGNYGNGIRLANTASGNFIRHNTITTWDSWANGITLSGTDVVKNVLDNNTINTDAGNGKGVMVSEAPGTKIFNNTITTQGGFSDAVRLYSASGVLVIGNNITTRGGIANGILAMNDCFDLVCNDNTIFTEGSFSQGINLSDPSAMIGSNLDIKTTNTLSSAIMARNATAIITDSALETTAGKDIVLLYDSNVTFVNVTFTDWDLSHSFGGVLRVLNYLDILVYQNESAGFMQDADVLIKDNSISIYNSTGYGGSDVQTDAAGTITTQTIVDRWYAYSDTAIQNTTTVWVKKTEDGNWEEVRAVDMANSHTEVFISKDITRPSTPAGLSVLQTGPGMINITWTANSDDSMTYSIYTNRSGSWEIIKNLTHPAQEYNDTYQFEHGVRYYYRMSAWDEAALESLASTNESLVFSDSTPPSTPSNLQVVKVAGVSAINISWDANSDDTRIYSIYSNRSGSWEIIQNITHPATYFVDNYPFTHGLTYYYRITSWDEVPFESASTANESVVFMDDIQPPVPAGLSAQPVVGGDAINITWTPNPGIDTVSYVIYSNRSGSWSEITVVTHPKGYYVDSNGHVHGTRYFYKISARDIVPNESPQSAEASCVHADYLPAQVPNGLSVTPLINGDSLNVSWFPNTDDTAYYMIYTNRSGGWELLATVNHPGFIYFDNSDLIHGTRYYYRITASDEVPNESFNTNPVSTLHEDQLKPAAPVNLKAGNVTGTSIDLAWEPNTEADLEGYVIYVNSTGSGASGPFINFTTVGPMLSEYTVKDLLEETIYYFVIEAFDEVPLFSGYSNIASNTTRDSTAPSAPKLSVLPQYTNDTELVVHGTTEPNVTVKVQRNDGDAGEGKTDADGEFIITITLKEGSNVIMAFAVDRFSNAGPSSVPQTVVLDTVLPFANAGRNIFESIGIPVKFNASSSYDEHAGIMNYTWRFEYDNKSIKLYGVLAEFTFEHSGEYPVVLRVVDFAGNWHEDSILVTIVEGPVDRTPPGILLDKLFPPVNGKNIPIRLTVVIPFDEKVSVGSFKINLSGELITVSRTDYDIVGGSVSYDETNTTINYKLSRDLLYNQTYTANLTVEDLFENKLKFSWSFTTTEKPVIPPDIHGPEVNSTGFHKANNRLPVDGQITIPFTEPLNASNIQITVRDSDDVEVTGVVAYDEETNTVVFTPDAPLDYDTEYTVTIQVEDTSQNPISDENNTYTFTTEKEEGDELLSPFVMWAMIFVIVIVVILIVVMLAIQRKREKPSDAEDEVEDIEDVLEE